MDDPRYDPRMLAKYGFDPEQDRRHRQLLIKELTKVRQDAREKTEFDDLPLKELRDNYHRLYAEACKDMEKIRDPTYLELLQYIKGHLHPDEFKSIRIEVYAACNKISMQQVFSGQDSSPGGAA
ncbi:unnamed protein product [Spodoptera littoralis]|uniref:Uncharacterized protein n=1 Tax=Spodoptera littoralis TaxID=7109 RepID=A0A9P0IIJ8_SPOLI|nr:unnamed protein product [Spodoptera littoralis]CAH1647346.1 unnamed protein product [Spodoptera littoralis]